MIAVFPQVSIEVIRTILYERWGVKKVPAYMDGELLTLFAAFDARVVPTSALIDANGEVVKYYGGFPSEGEIIQALRSVVGKE